MLKVSYLFLSAVVFTAKRRHVSEDCGEGCPQGHTHPGGRGDHTVVSPSQTLTRKAGGSLLSLVSLAY